MVTLEERIVVLGQRNVVIDETMSEMLSLIRYTHEIATALNGKVNTLVGTINTLGGNINSLGDTVNTKLGHSTSLTMFDALEDFRDRLERIESKLE